MACRPVFGAEELDALGNAVGIAREMIGQFFGLPDDWFQRTSHQVCTLRDLRHGEILGKGRLAQIRKLQRVLEAGPDCSPRCTVCCPHYRICLQDHNILHHLREGRELGARDLLTFVLTHEYVHLVRFDRLEYPYLAFVEDRGAEEARVAELTRAIVSRLGPKGLRRLVP